MRTENPMRLAMHLDTQFETDWGSAQWGEMARIWEEHSLFELTSDPARADFILITIVDPKIPYHEVIELISALPSYRDYTNKVFVYDTSDAPMGLYPGLYCSLRKRLFDKSRHKTGAYLTSFNEHVDYRDPTASSTTYLFSFQGNLTSKARQRLLNEKFKNSDILIERTKPFWHDIGSREFDHFKQGYVQTIWDSAFVLCPRGNGTSSFRLFETMQSGRVPVIISDHWVPNENVAWDECSLRVSERHIDRLPAICSANLHRWELMARRARQEWEHWFSPVGLANSIQTAVTEIAATRKHAERWYRLQWPLRKAYFHGRAKAVQTLSKILTRT
jgi:hypothetical protein